jgi:glycosyltransferase involved in cell wall biosynthesis
MSTDSAINSGDPQIAPLSIVVPVYNEAANFPALWRELSDKVRTSFFAFVVYDFEGDTTVPVVRQIIAEGESRLRLVKNERPGVVGAILTGFEQVQRGPLIVLMADLSDDLARIDAMLDLYWKGYQIVVGSRYMRGGAIVNGPWLKQTLSRMGGLSLHWLRGLPTHDATNAFKLYDAAMLRALTLESRGGFELSLEITVKAFLAGYRIAEIPAVWHERTQGKSRFKLWSWLPHYLRWWVYAFRPRKPRPALATHDNRGPARLT